MIEFSRKTFRKKAERTPNNFAQRIGKYSLTFFKAIAYLLCGISFFPIVVIAWFSYLITPKNPGEQGRATTDVSDKAPLSARNHESRHLRSVPDFLLSDNSVDDGPNEVSGSFV